MKLLANVENMRRGIVERNFAVGRIEPLRDSIAIEPKCFPPELLSCIAKHLRVEGVS